MKLLIKPICTLSKVVTMVIKIIDALSRILRKLSGTLYKDDKTKQYTIHHCVLLYTMKTYTIKIMGRLCKNQDKTMYNIIQTY